MSPLDLYKFPIVEKLKSFLSSRPIAGIIFTILLCGFIYLHKYLVKLNEFDRSYYHLCELILIFPLIFWSIYEIFRLDSRFSRSFLRVLIGSLLASAPIFIYVFCFFIGGGSRPSEIRWIGFFIVGLVSMYLYATAAYGSTNVLDFDNYSRQYPFRRLLVMSSIFWNLFLYMCFSNNYLWLGVLAIFAMANDTIAYIFGRIFGSRKVFKSSPNKTLEGFIISILLTPIIYSTPLIYFFRERLNTPNKMTLLLPSLYLISIVSNCGDLFYSQQKRMFGVKDYGRLIGSHGGFWDRFDSQTFVLLAGAPIFLIFF